MTDHKLAAEVVKLKQEVAELRATIARIDEAVGDMLKDHDGWGHAEDSWPWDVSATDGIAAGTRKPETLIPG